MKRDDMILISVDDHIIEPPDMFVNHVPREQATVGALRKQAECHDVSVRSRSHRAIAPAEKLETYQSRARAAIAAAR